MYFKGANGKDVPNFVGLVLGTTVAILVNRPEPCEQIFQTKNKYFDKHPRSARIGKKLLGNSILFAKSDVVWQRKRKALSAALYKEKVKQMLEMIKNVTMDVIENEWMEAKDQTIDIVTAASKIFFKVTLQGFLAVKTLMSKCNKRLMESRPWFPLVKLSLNFKNKSVRDNSNLI
jgi:cytochrome P450